MFDIGVPVTTFNFHQGTVLDPISKNNPYLQALPALYRLVTNRDPSFSGAELAHSQFNRKPIPNAYWLEQLYIYFEHPEISEAIGFNDIFLAVIRRDEERLKSILQDDQFDLTRAITQEDLHGRTIIQIAVPWPTGLSLLLQHHPLLLSQNSHLNFSASPLDLALVFSGTRCNASDHFAPCHNCDCSLSAQLLLEADCSVTVGKYSSYALGSCSLKARILFFQHLRNRRERLRDASIAYLSADIMDRYAITADSLPDANAEYLWDELMTYASTLDLPGGMKLGEGLRPHSYPKGGCSLFIYPLPTGITDLALQFGFRPLDEYGLPPLLSQVQFCTFPYGFGTAAAHTNWLLQQNLGSSYSRGNIFLTAYHRYGAQIGLELYTRYILEVTASPPLNEFYTLLSRICSSNATSKNPCPCLSEPFHKPLAYLISALMRDASYWRKIRQCLCITISVVNMIQTAVPDIEAAYLARCAAHMLTMRSLGIRHFPMCGDHCSWEERVGRDPALIEEWSQIVEEDRMLVEQLRDLDVEFEEEFERRNESVADFLGGYWWGRMEEVKRDMERPLSVDERRGLLDVGVILDDETDNHLDSGSK
ncbi:hypothetical protein DER45DRAFT_577423 [Fusarium avenaceum]|nr:hypothetical protein DER45DRAFT_577423 [Fusarium avenaceum]